MSLSHIKVCPDKLDGKSGWSLEAYYRDCSDSMYESLYYAEVFERREDAEAAAAAVKPSWHMSKDDWAKWGAVWGGAADAFKGKPARAWVPAKGPMPAAFID